MKCVILAAGKGSRLFPVTATRPKVLVPLMNAPLLEHVLVQAKKAGLNDFLFVVSSQKNMIMSYFADGSKWDVTITYVDQGTPFGTAHAIQACEQYVDGTFVVLSGDTLTSVTDIRGLMKQKPITVATTQVDDAKEYGVISVDGTRLRGIYEKTDQPLSNQINAGMYVFDKRIFEAITGIHRSHRKEYEITDAINNLIQSKHPPLVCPVSTWVDISRPWDILDANQFLLEQLKKPLQQGNIEPWATVKGPVYIGKDTLIRNGSYIQGPVHIGSDCEIGPNCYIRPYTSIGDGCHVGNACEIKNTVLMKNSKIPHQNYVGDSVIGENCNLGAGTKIANLRLDKKTISVSHLGTKIHSGRRKLGVIMGDDVQTGINAQINTGSIIGNGSYIGVGAICSGTFAPHSRIY